MRNRDFGLFQVLYAITDVIGLRIVRWELRVLSEPSVSTRVDSTVILSWPNSHSASPLFEYFAIL